MPQIFDFAIIQLAPGQGRGERLNVGAIVFKEDGLDVHLPKRLDKIRALSSALDPESLRALIHNFVALDRLAIRDGVQDLDERKKQLQDMGPVIISPTGRFSAASATEYADRMARIISSLVDPEPAPIRAQLKRSKLLTLVKGSFRKQRVLAKKGEEIESHRILQNWKLAEGLIADLVLKNGAMHVIETVDASSVDGSARKVISDVAVAALVLEQARMTYGEPHTKSKLVYDASSAMEAMARPSLDAAAHQGVDLINWASENDRNRFVESIAALAVPFEEPKRAKKKERFIASTQSRLLLH